MIRYKRLPKNIQSRINLLSDFFNNDSNIIFTYLFGGLLRKRKGLLHDVDIAVYAKNTKKLNYLDLFDKITSFLGTEEVDLVVLNISPLSITGRILQNRKVLTDKDPFLRHRFESDVLRKYFDFEIKERYILHRRYGIG
jgi:predicted nucleotidyltransferase